MTDYRKPHLAEVLGVEVNERFKNRLEPQYTLWIDKTGKPHADEEGIDEVEVMYLVIDCINNPQRFDRGHYLTDEELTICKDVGAKWITRAKLNGNTVQLWESKPVQDSFCNYDVTAEGYLATCSCKLFPSVDVGSSFGIDGMYEDDSCPWD